MAKKSKPRRSRNQRTSGKSNYMWDGLVSLMRPLVNTEKEWGVEKMNELANATQEYAASLEGTPNLSAYTMAAAESLQALADYVNENEFDQILYDSIDYAKRHPLPMIIGGAIAGLVVTQMLRTRESGSNKRRRPGNASHRSRPARSVRARGNGRRFEDSTRLNA
jgi:hypothetical protein